MKEIITKKKELLIKIALTISFSMIGLLLMPLFDPKIAIYNSILTVYISIIVFQKISIKKLKKNKLILSLLIGAYVDQLLVSISTLRIEMIQQAVKIDQHLLPSMIGLCSYPSTVFCIYWWIEKHHPRIMKELRTLKKEEKRYLQIVGILSILLVSIISIYTSTFHIPTHQEEPIVDVIYTSDNATILQEDAWFNISHPENDIRQPLFGVFALPFSIPAHIISELVFFVPRNISYGVVLSIIQFLLLAFTTIMIVRLLKLEDYQKKYAYLFFSISFPYLLFGLIVEQYVIALFYLILTIYQYENLKDERNDSFLGAAATLITSSIIFPMITKSKNLKEILNHYRESLISFLIIFILGGQFVQIMTIKSKIVFFMRDFTGNDTILAKWNKYTTFIKNIFIIECGHVEKLLNYDVYRLSIPKTVNILGIVILGIVVFSFIINRKEKIARISALWILFSFAILCLIGWGNVENGLILYSLYFSWAFYSLFILFIKKIIKDKKIFSIIMIIIIGIMFIFTSKELVNILKFALKYYHR